MLKFKWDTAGDRITAPAQSFEQSWNVDVRGVSTIIMAPAGIRGGSSSNQLANVK